MRERENAGLPHIAGTGCPQSGHGPATYATLQGVNGLQTGKQLGQNESMACALGGLKAGKKRKGQRLREDKVMLDSADAETTEWPVGIKAQVRAETHLGKQGGRRAGTPGRGEKGSVPTVYPWRIGEVTQAVVLRRTPTERPTLTPCQGGHKFKAGSRSLTT